MGDDLLLVERIASGGMADLYVGIQTGLGGFEKTVAVKRIAQRFSDDEGFQSQLQSEAAISSRLQHRNIAQVFRCAEHDGCLCLIMEFIEGKTASDIVRRARELRTSVPIAAACTIISEIARGLAYAHTLTDDRTGQPLHIVHRDVSPQNIMVSYDGEVKLLDFGIAKAVTSLDATKTGTLKGKVRYMSPEQVEGRPLDHRSDLFSLGIVFQEILTGETVFGGSSVFEIARKISIDPIPPLVFAEGESYPEIERIMSKLLQRDPADRYSSGREVAADLEHCIRELSPHFDQTHLVAMMESFFGADRDKERAQRREAFGKSGIYDNAPPGTSRTTVLPGSGVRRRRRQFAAIVAALVIVAIAFISRRSPGRFVPGTVLRLEPNTLEAEPGNPISEWKSAVGGLKCTQSRQEFQPRVTTIPESPELFVNFDGINDYLECDEAALKIRNADGLSIVAVVAPRIDKVQYYWNLYDGGMIDLFRIGFIAGGALRIGEHKYQYHDYVVTDPFSPSVIITVADRERARVFRNGNIVAELKLTQQLTLSNAARLSIGMDWDNKVTRSDHFGGQIGFVAVVARSITDLERTRVEKMLVNRFRLTKPEMSR